jgi:hypothetical protein
MPRVTASRINHSLPAGWVMLVAAAIAYRAMMTQPVPEREPGGDRLPAAPRRPALVPV